MCPGVCPPYSHCLRFTASSTYLAGAEVLWCNARVGALGFYLRLGFATIGEEFEIAGIGPHFVMWRDLRT